MEEKYMEEKYVEEKCISKVQKEKEKRIKHGKMCLLYRIL
jgi:hypothetical protein